MKRAHPATAKVIKQQRKATPFMVVIMSESECTRGPLD